MGIENGRPGLRGLYADPARPLTVAVGQVFDLVSMPKAVGLVALEALRSRRARLGPVVADSRLSVMRTGFLQAPGSLAEAAALLDWTAGPGSGLGVRAGGEGTTATPPPLFPAWHGWLRRLVPPGSGPAAVWTPASALLAALAETTELCVRCGSSVP